MCTALHLLSGGRSVSMRTSKLLALLLVLCPRVSLAADPPYYAKKATWQETLRASREALVRYEAEQAGKATPEKPVAQPTTLHLDTWYAVGPFVPAGGRKNFTFAFPPEKEAGLMASNAAVAELEGASPKAALAKSYGKMRWRAMPQYRDGVVHMMNAPTNGSTYLYRTITVPAPMTVTGYFGSDDGMRAWLNGKVILSHDTPRGPGPNQDKAALKLHEGANHLLLKIHNNSGGHGFYFHTKPTPVGGGSAPPDPKQLRRDGLWALLARDFRETEARHQMQWERDDNIWQGDWNAGDFKALGQRYAAATRMPSIAREAKGMLAGLKGEADLQKVRGLYYQALKVEQATALVRNFNFTSLRLAVDDLTETFPEYPRKFRTQLDALEKRTVALADAIAKGDKDATKKLGDIGTALRTVREEALLANPLLEFGKLLLVKRRAGRLGLPQNWQGNCALPRNGYDDQIAVLSSVRPGSAITTLYKPKGDQFVGDVDLHFDADRMLFSSLDERKRWQVFEVKADGSSLRQVTPKSQADVDNYDACYLPDGRVIYASTACFHGVPCVGGGNTVANLYLLNPKDESVRRLTFEQDHNWCPTVLNNGRVLYARWEYSDSPHYFTRVLMHMNPDGTEQMEYAFSNSYWPNSTFYARPIPGHPTKFVAVISGHHGVPRMGELILYDTSRGRHETSGCLQRIPGYGKPVPARIADGLVNGSWPKFLHPYPLGEHDTGRGGGKYFVVSCQPTSRDPWGIYLVDIYDNMLLLAQEPGYALMEPIPFQKTPTPPAIPDKADPKRKDAILFLADVYSGDGLKGVPRGTVKKLRVYAFHYAYPGMGGHISIGIDGPWDVHRILGTVPVQPDGSCSVRVPANTPMAVQPLDEDGKALQVMRSWMVAMPGEILSCVGCHERQNTTPPNRRLQASSIAPVDLDPWHGPPRGFSFPRDVQPVLDKHCVGCHDGSTKLTTGGKPSKSGKTKPNFADTGRGARNFTKSYLAIHPYVRRPGPESDYHLQKPCEWHADTSELVQMLAKGHHGVKLDADAWDRLITWIDLNVPDHGTWAEHRGVRGKGRDRRNELNKLYAAVDVDPEAVIKPDVKPAAFIKPTPPKKPMKTFAVDGWPFDAAEARKRQAAAGLPAELKLPLADGVTIDLVLVPAGQFLMGDIGGEVDEWDRTVVHIAKPFYMGRTEVTNAQFRAFDPAHDSGYISVYNKDQGNRGVAANGATQPVIRVTWQQAMDFCYWVEKATGRKCSLPSEAQWEYACRAGTATAMSYGDVGADFGKHANFADRSIHNLCRRDSPKWIPAITAVSDGAVAAAQVGRYQPNAWGLCDLHGNVAEWTRTTYKPYPYTSKDGRNEPAPDGRKVVRGGSFYERPKRGRSAFRLSYPAWQPVYNVGFRIIVGPDGKTIASAAAAR